MTITSTKIIGILITLFIGLLAFFTHNARFKACIELGKEFASNRLMLIFLFVVVSLLQYGSVGILFAILYDKINVFTVFYLFVPLFLEGNRIILKNQVKYDGYFQLIKGIYYAIMIAVSIAQLIYNYSDPVNLLFGASIAIAIFNGIDEIEKGIGKLTKSSNKDNQ